MAARARSTAQKRKRAFITRSQGMIRKVKEMHRFTDAKTAVVGIHNGKMFWYDETNVLSQLGIAHEAQDRLTARISTCSSVFSSSESVSSFTSSSGSSSPRLAMRECSSELSEMDTNTSALSTEAESLRAEDEAFIANEAWESPRSNKSPRCRGILSLDLDFFGLENDNEYGV